MSSFHLKICAFTTVAVLGATAAQAADLYMPPPPAPAPEFAAGWYLRGYVGVGLNSKADLDYQTVTNATLQFNSNDDSVFVGGAVGYDFNNWLRFDASAEYRNKSRVYALVTYPPNGIDQYEGYIKSWVFLANAFVDLGTWNCFTPFIGAGIGGAYNTLSDFYDVNPNGGFGFGRNPSEWHLAYAFYAGIGYEVTKNFKIDLTYRYLNYGSITDTVDCNVTCTHDSFKFGNLHSNDIMLGLRWTCCEIPRVVDIPPLHSKG